MTKELDVVLQYWRKIKDIREFHQNKEWFNSSTINSQLKVLKNFRRETGLGMFSEDFFFSDHEITTNPEYVRTLIISAIHKIDRHPVFEEIRKKKLIDKFKGYVDA